MNFIGKVMNSAKSALLVGLVILVAAGSLFASGKSDTSAWQTDYDVAFELAQEQDKNVFLLFTGLAWDTVSQALKTDIFETDEFRTNVGKNYILLHIDIDGNDETVPEDIALKNYEFALRMGVQSAPTAFLVTPGGQPFALLPLSHDTKLPADLIALVDAESDNAQKISVVYNEMKMAEGTARVKAIDAYVAALPVNFAINLSDLYAEVLVLDPENTTGLLGKYKLFLAQEEAARAHATGDVDTALTSFLVLIDEPNLLDALQIQNAYYLMAYYAAQSGTVPMDEVITYLRQAYNVAPKSRSAPDILTLINEFGASE